MDTQLHHKYLRKNSVHFVVECCHCLLLVVNFRKFSLLGLYLVLFSVSLESVLPICMCLRVCCVSLVFPILLRVFPSHFTILQFIEPYISHLVLL